MSEIPTIDCTGLVDPDKTTTVFANSWGDTKIIEKIITKEDNTYSNWFKNATGLLEIRFEGIIGNDISFSDCKQLTGASIENIVESLSDTATGKTLTLSKAAVESAFDDVVTVIPFGLTTDQEGANVTGVDNGDGTATFNGTIEYDTYFSYGNATDVFSAGSYVFNAQRVSGGDIYVSVYDLDGNTLDFFGDGDMVGGTRSFTSDVDFVVKTQLYMYGAANINNVVIAYPTIRPDSTESENLIKYPYVDSEIQIDIYGYIRSNSDGTIAINTEDCWSRGMYNFRLCTLTLPAGRYKMTSASDKDIGLYGDELSFDVVDTAIEEIIVSTNGSNGSYEFTLTEEKEVTFTYLFNMLTAGSRYTVTPSLVRINETDWDALTATKPNWTIIEA